MKYYWSCWFKEDALKESGAMGIIHTDFHWNCLEPIKKPNATWYDFVFKADESFPTFMKIKEDKSMAEIPESYYFNFVIGNAVILPDDEDSTSKAIRNCRLDF